MAIAFMSPADFVHWVTVEGLKTSGGHVRLKRYVSASPGNGGSHTSDDLCAKLYGLMAKKGNGPKLRNPDRVHMGQGYVDDFIALWSWMHDNLDDVRKLSVQTYLPDKPKEGKIAVKHKLLNLADVFKIGRSFPDGMHDLIKEGCFGWDCIGFVSQYLMAIGHLDKYETWKSHNYISHGKFVPIKNLDDITPACIGVFGTWHIVMIDKVYEISIDEDSGTLTAKVSVSQSYTGGPHTRDHKILTQARVGKRKDGSGIYGPIKQSGVIDVAHDIIIARHPDIVVQYPPYVAAPE